MADANSHSDRAWKVAQLAAMLARPYVGDNQGLASEQNRQLELDALVRDAQYLLERAESAARIVRAHELFNTDSDFLSVEAIRKRFTAEKWPGLCSWPSVSNLLEEILKALGELQPQMPLVNATSDQDDRITALAHLRANDPTRSALWVTPFVRGARKQKAYRARTLFLLASLYLEGFKDRLELVHGRENS